MMAGGCKAGHPGVARASRHAGGGSRPSREASVWDNRSAGKKQQIRSSLTSGVTLAGVCGAPELPCPSREEGHHFWKQSRGAPRKAVKSSGPGAGLSEFKSSQCYSLAVCLLACYLASLCLGLHIGKRWAPTPQRSQRLK